MTEEINRYFYTNIKKVQKKCHWLTRSFWRIYYKLGTYVVNQGKKMIETSFKKIKIFCVEIFQ